MLPSTTRPQAWSSRPFTPRPLYVSTGMPRIRRRREASSSTPSPNWVPGTIIATGRDPEGEGLVYIRRPWESGMDNSPVWDQTMQRLHLRSDQVPRYHRADIHSLRLGPPDQWCVRPLRLGSL